MKTGRRARHEYYARAGNLLYNYAYFGNKFAADAEADDIANRLMRHPPQIDRPPVGDWRGAGWIGPRLFSLAEKSDYDEDAAPLRDPAPAAKSGLLYPNGP